MASTEPISDRMKSQTYKLDRRTAVVLWSPRSFLPSSHRRSKDGIEDSTGISQNPSSNSPFPDPSLDDKLFHLLLHPAPSLPMVPHSDIAAFVPWEEDEDDATYAGDRRDRHEFGGPHPEGSVHVRNREVQDDVFGPSIDEEDQHDNPSVTQWRVGKTPGHQGSHARTHKTTSSSECLSPTSIGEKRSLSQSITDSAERVLKKPFRLPAAARARIVLPKASPKDTSSSPQRSLTSSHLLTPKSSPSYADRATSPSSNPSTRTSASDLDPSFPIFKSAPKPIRPAFIARAAPSLRKPFKTPVKYDRSGAPSPASVSSRTSRPSGGGGLTLSRANPNTGKNVNPTDSDRPQIANLESKVRKLNQALTYIENPEKVAELQDLVDVWRAGGREIVERLFHIVPRPEEFSSALRHGQTSSTSFQWSDDVKRPSMMTQEQRDYLAHAPTDDDGDPIDSEGNSLLPDMMSQDELMRAIEAEANLGERRLGTGAYLPTSFVKRHGQADNESFEMNGSDLTTAKPLVPWSWNYGTMMERFQVEPGLLGWSAEEEDWVDE